MKSENKKNDLSVIYRTITFDSYLNEILKAMKWGANIILILDYVYVRIVDSVSFLYLIRFHVISFFPIGGKRIFDICSVNVTL